MTIPADDNDCQNPDYPGDALLTEDEFNAKARACSMMRAISPGERECVIDPVEIESADDPLAPSEHYPTHSYTDYMNWRHSHIDSNTGAIIADGDPWTPYLTADAWAEIAPPQPPLPPPPIPPVGWNPRARINPSGISQMDALPNGPGGGGTWAGYTIMTQVDGLHVLHPALILGGNATRVRLQGPFTTIEAYIGPLQVSSIALALYRLTFNGSFTGSADVTGYVTSDALPFGFDGSHGFMFSMYVTVGKVGQKTIEPGWMASFAIGNQAAQLDKSNAQIWTPLTGQGSFGLVEIDGYYS
jgi:hypothetical protein